MELSNADLEGLAGGLNPQTANAVAAIYLSAGQVLEAAGNFVAAASFYGRATGVIEGAKGGK